MVTALLGLAGAVLTVVLYVALTEHLDYTSVRRRQLDSWAILMALAWLAGILYGGADARRAAHVLPGPAVRPTARVEPIHRIRPPVLDRDPALVAVAPPSGPAVPAARPGPQLATAAPAGVDAVGASAGEDGAAAGDRAGRRPAGAPPVAAGAALPTAVLRQQPFGGFFATSVAPPPTALALLLPTATPPPPSTATPPPTALPPTSVPPLPPPATPSCGDPRDIRLAVEILEAEAEYREHDVVIRYRIRVSNESAFPVTMADIVVTALNRSSGSEQFGHDTRPDVLVQPGAVLPLDGAVQLTKRPSPFGETVLCLGFVGETCGAREPYRVTRRCSTVGGF
jgi:hypothetical protein